MTDLISGRLIGLQVVRQWDLDNRARRCQVAGDTHHRRLPGFITIEHQHDLREAPGQKVFLCQCKLSAYECRNILEPA